MTCSICGTPVVKRAGDKAFPFCSHRCQLIDLGRWLGEEYRIPVEHGDGEPPVAPPSRRGDDG
ncbi:MAG: DNA gyrase inhibitor YacG [Deltaproteobacteria bacterium]|nr:DNA gyrase inhibitor YacG [Deltaproteobacteria bacterium]MCW5802399.1 DNA gyrase inhibitor YacG [Deltaproteobacteria bacterium]